MYDLDGFREDLRNFGIELTRQQEEKFIRYYEILSEWNGFMNLTAITEFQDVLKKHFVDSLSIVTVYGELLKRDPFSVIDIGTGAGFPGVPIKIVFPHIRITLLDSLQKRIRFLEEVVKELDLQGVQLVHGRAEDAAREENHREKYDLCVSRAVADLSVLSELCLPFVKEGGFFVSYKSEKITEEAGRAQHAVELLAGEFYGQKEFYLPRSDIFRNLFQIRKTGKTPKRYPRKAGVPSKQPL